MLAILTAPAMALCLAACFVMNGLIAEQDDGGTHRQPGSTDPEGDSATGPTDDGATPAAGGCDVGAPFTQFAPLTELNTPDDEELPRLTRDELTIYFFSELDDGGSAAHVAQRPLLGSAFAPPTRLFPQLTNPRAPSPATSPLRLYYSDGTDGWNLQLAERGTATDSFTPSRTVLKAGSTESLSYPVLFDGPNGSTRMFFIHWQFQSPQDENGQADVWQADVDGTGNVANPRPLGGVNTADAELDPTPSTDGLTLYFYSEHGLPIDQGRVFIATRASTDVDFGAPRIVSEIAVPAGGWVSPSSLSTDRCRLYFYRAETTQGNADLFVATRAAGSSP